MPAVRLPCCAASNARRSAATRSGSTWRRPTNGLPEHVKTQIAGLRARHSIEATFGAAMPIEKRLALKAQYPDAEHPVVRTHPETGEKVLFVNAFTTHFTNFHTPANVRFGQDCAPGASQLLNYLISQAYIPEYQVRWRWQHEQRRDLGQPLHAALRRAGLLAGRPQDGARRNHRRPAVLSARREAAERFDGSGSRGETHSSRRAARLAIDTRLEEDI